jgi:hypothetical protein
LFVLFGKGWAEGLEMRLWDKKASPGIPDWL